MSEFDRERDILNAEVDTLAARYVREGIFTPMEALEHARNRIMRKRREKANARMRDEAVRQ